MNFGVDSAINEGSLGLLRMGDSFFPLEFTGTEDEYMATRTTASLGVFLTMSPVLDITGPDAVKFLNSVCVNRDFAKMKLGGSRHGLICNEKGQMLATGVILRKTEDCFRTYWMAPAIHYYLITSGMDVKGEYIEDEYFYQIDGPKSLEILEKATGEDLHDLKFAQNKTVKIDGTDMVVYRLGMSGALAYELHGAAKDAETAYKRLREVLFEYGGKLQGVRNYSIVLHTPGGYPNQLMTFDYPFETSGEGLAEFTRNNPFRLEFVGSASDDRENMYANPYDVGWGNLVNFDHEFLGKKALYELSKNPPRQPVTLVWNADDVGKVFASQFSGSDAERYEQLEYPTNFSSATVFMKLRTDYVLVDGKKVGISTGRTYAYYEHRMISLALLDNEYAIEGKEVSVLWGTPGKPQTEIRAQIAKVPYYDGEFRNETFDVNNIPRLK